jgi:hypothetical protein
MMKPKIDISRRRYMSCLPATIWLLSGFMYLFSSCEREDGNVSPSTGEMVTVNFTVNEKAFGVNEVNLKNQTSPDPSLERETSLSGDIGEGFPSNELSEIIPITENLYMHAILKEEAAPVKLRFSTLDAGTKVRVVVYESPGYTTKAGHADYEISGSGTLIPLSAPLMVATGTYMFVCYSYNDTDPMSSFADITSAVTSRDLLWGSTTTAVSTTNGFVHILLEHLFSQIKLHVSLNHAAGSVINDIQGVVFDHTFPTLVVQSNTLTTGTNNQIPFVWSSGAGNASEWYSINHYVYTNGSAPVVTIDNMTIDSNLYAGQTINFITPLAPGYTYTLFIYFTKDGILCGDLETPSSGTWGNY